MEIHAYLAGPDVFYPDAVEIGKRKKSILAEYNIIGHFPFDSQIDYSKYNSAHKIAMAIGKADEDMMFNCCLGNRIGIILANMTPFHGPSMDIGTGFEMGYMSALADMKKNVIIIGYTDDKRSFQTRVIEDHYNNAPIIEQNGLKYGPDGNLIEFLNQAENLMITHAIEKTGGKLVYSFEEAAKSAHELAQLKLEVLCS